MDSSELVAIMVGGVTLISLTAIVGGLLHTRRERILTHTERMKALDLGRPMPGDPLPVEPSRPPIPALTDDSHPRRCFSVAFRTAFWGFFAAAFYGLMIDQPGDTGVSYVIAISAGTIGVTGLICGTVLAATQGKSDPTDRAVHLKPYTEADAFDVVSRRG